jgi:hypothetical protein
VPDVTDGAGNPLGPLPVALITTADSVSVTVNAVTVAVPVFVTTIEYVTGAPIPGDAGVWIFTTVSPVTTGGRSTPTALLNRFTCAHAIPPATYAVFDTCVAAHTTP